MPLTTVSQGLLSTDAQYTGFKNRLINGDMQIDQRNNGAAVTAPAGYFLDRWRTTNTNPTRWNVQQNAGSVTPPVGFVNYLGATSAGSYSVVSGDTFNFTQRIEGLNTSDLSFGTANASTVTVSFWVRSSLTGTFAGSLQNSAQNRSYVFTFVINAANTWEYKTITIAGDTTGTWLTTNGIGLQLNFNLGNGSTFATTAGAWQSGEFYGVSGGVNLVGTSGATFYITGVQLEKGSVATSFDVLDYGTELAMCQRYCVVYGGSGIYETYGYGNAVSTGTVQTLMALPVSMRTTPSISVSGSIQISDGANGFVIFVLSVGTVQSNSQQIVLNATSSGLTQFRTYRLENNNNTTSRIFFLAEL